MSSPTTPHTPPQPDQPLQSPAQPRQPTTDIAPAAGARTAICDWSSHLRLWIPVATGLALDLWSKHWAFRSLGLYGRRELIPRVLEFQTMMNDGALFGIGSGRTVLFLVASVLALVLVLWMFGHSSPRQRLLHLALGAILAGALGNMYDRVFVRLVEVSNAAGARRYYVKAPSPDGQHVILREYAPPPGHPPHQLPLSALPGPPQAIGHVRDFIKIPTKIFGERDLWPWVFNVADMLLVGGVGILAVRLWRERRLSARKKTELDLKADRA